MLVWESVLQSTVMVFVTTAKALPPMSLRASPVGEQGMVGPVGASRSRPEGRSATSPTAGGDTKAALVLCCSLSEEHLLKAVANMGLHLSVVASAAALLRMIVKAKSGPQLAAMLWGHPSSSVLSPEGGRSASQMALLCEGQSRACRGSSYLCPSV